MNELNEREKVLLNQIAERDARIRQLEDMLAEQNTNTANGAIENGESAQENQPNPTKACKYNKEDYVYRVDGLETSAAGVIFSLYFKIYFPYIKKRMVLKRLPIIIK